MMIKMRGDRTVCRGLILVGALLLACPPPSSALSVPGASLAGEGEETEKGGLQEEADYPDLIGEDEEDEMMDEFAFLQEEDFVFTAAKHRQKAGLSPSAVIVITRKDIEESGATTLMELLRRYPAIHVYMFDPVYPTAEIWGTYQVLLRVDNRQVTLDFFQAPFYALLPIGLRDIERIEIVLGPNSALYGADAVSAVINIATRPPSGEFRADFSVAAGEHGSSIVEGMLGGDLGPIAVTGSFGIDRANSWMDRWLLSKDIKRANVTLRLDLPDGSLTANAGLVTVAGRMFALMGYLDTDEFLMAHAKAEFELGDFKARAYWYGLRTEIEFEIGLVHPDMGVDLGDVPIFDMAGDTAHVEAQYDLELFEDNLLIAGADYRLTSYRSDQFVDPDIREHRVGVFLHDEHRFTEKLLLTIGARLDWNNKTELAISPRAALVYNPGGEHFLRLSAGRAFRKPTMMETSMNFKIIENPAFPEMKELFEKRGISNPDLRNQIMTAVEAGYRGSLFDKALRLGADVYLGFNRQSIDFETYIHFEQTPLGPRIDMDKSRIGYDNMGRDTNILGINLSVEGEPFDELTLFLRGEFRYKWLEENGNRDTWTTPFLSSAGATLRCPFDLVAHLAFVCVYKRSDAVRDPVSILAPSIQIDVPTRVYALGAIVYTIRLERSRLDLGLSLFNPFGGRFREEMGTRAPDGSNYGGELIGTRAMLTARFRY